MSAAVKEIEIQTEVTEDFGMGSLEATVQMEVQDAAEKPVYLWARLIDKNGEEADRIFPVPAEEKIEFCMQAEKPILWNAEYPYLYELVLEVRDEENCLLGCAVKKTAFFRWEKAEGVYVLNGKVPRFRAFSCEEITEENLNACKQSFCNTIFTAPEKQTVRARERCLEYGIYLLDQENAGLQAEKQNGQAENPDFELNVVNQGVLIENRSTYSNTNLYELYYSLRKEGSDRFFSAGITETDIPAGISRYVELPFGQPDEPGTYIYHAALRLKEKTPWADQGAEIAVSESRIANLFCGV